MFICLQEVNIHGLSHLQPDRQVDGYKRIIDQEEAAESLGAKHYRSVGILENVSVLIGVLLCEAIVEVAQKCANRDHQDNVDSQDLVNHLIHVGLLKSVLSLVQDQLGIVSCIKDK